MNNDISFSQSIELVGISVEKIISNFMVCTHWLSFF